jgi:hypothetical protein
MKRLALCLVLALVHPARADGPAKAPPFRLEATSGATRTLGSYAGKVVLLMYEDRDSRTINAALKEEVRQRIAREGLQQRLAVVPVADVSSYDRWPARGIVRAAVAREARALGAEILLDWSGEIRRAYALVTPGSNVVLVGRGGERLYQKSGALDVEERARFRRALERALASGISAADSSGSKARL